MKPLNDRTYTMVVGLMCLFAILVVNLADAAGMKALENRIKALETQLAKKP